MLILILIAGLYFVMVIITSIMIFGNNEEIYLINGEDGISRLWAFIWPIVWYRVIKYG